jgi:hypothetical protein
MEIIHCPLFFTAQLVYLRDKDQLTPSAAPVFPDIIAMKRPILFILTQRTCMHDSNESSYNTEVLFAVKPGRSVDMTVFFTDQGAMLWPSYR